MKKIYFLAIALALTVTLKAQVSEEEFQALKALYNATGGNNWTKKTGWQNINTTASANDVTSSWFGLEVIGGHVTKIGMNSNNLIGYLPTAIGKLTWLKYLETDNCKLEGAIPTEIGNLVNLQGITLSGNRFTSLPASMSNLVKLTYVYLGNNPLNIPFPGDMIKSMPDLEILNAPQCGFTGSLPDIFDKLPKLYIISLSRNQMTGEIPASFSKIKSLYSIDLSRNTFSGSLPPLDSCKAMNEIMLNGNLFTGFIPSSYSQLVSLKYFDINTNKIAGNIPAGFFNTPVQNFFINNNYFTFEGIEPHMVGINNLPSKSLSTNKLLPLKQSGISVNSGEPLSLSAANLSVYILGGNNNRYKWYRNDSEIYSGNDPSYSVAAAGTTHAGVYRFEVTNTVVTGITLKSENITVNVLVAGNKAPTDITLSSTSVSENYTGQIGMLSAADSDTGDTHNFTLSTGNGTNDKDNALFSIAGNNLVMKTSADFEAKQLLNLLLSANDLKGGVYTKALTLQVADVNEAPLFSGQMLNTTIDETAPNGHTVLLLLAKDPEGLAVNYTITQGNEDGAFGISGNKLVVANNTKLKYDTQNQYTLKVDASDGTLSSTIQLVVSLSKINKMPLVDNATFTIAENSQAGVVVGTVTGSDPEGATLSYLILAGNTDNAFRLTGNQITVNTPLALDYDAMTSFSLIINATDGISNVQAEITVNLNNLPDETGRDLLSLSVPGMVGQPVFNASTGSVTVIISGTDITALPATFSVSKGATADVPNNSTLNFFTPKVIKVTAETGLVKNWTVTVSYVTALVSDKLAKISVFPNPATDHLKVSGLLPDCSLLIIDMTGKKKLIKTNTEMVQEISVTDLKPGIYILKVEHAGINDVFKFIKK